MSMQVSSRFRVARHFLPAAMFLILFTLISCASAPDVVETPVEDAQVRDYREDIITLLETMDGIIMTGEIENDLSSVYRGLRQAIAGGTVRFYASEEPAETAFARSRFSFNAENGTASIFIDPTLLDDLRTNPVPALAEYAGVLSHIQDFVKYGADIEDLYADPLEYYLARMDRVYLQSLFLRDYATPIYGESALGDYENFLLQSFYVDGFSSYSMFVWGIDKDIVYSMLGFSTQAARGEVDQAAYIDEVMFLARSVRNGLEQSRLLYDESGEDDGDDGDVARRNMYIAATSAQTYRTLGSMIFSSVLTGHFSDEDLAAFAAQIGEIRDINDLLGDMLTPYEDFRIAYRKDYLMTY